MNYLVIHYHTISIDEFVEASHLHFEPRYTYTHTSHGHLHRPACLADYSRSAGSATWQWHMRRGWIKKATRKMDECLCWKCGVRGWQMISLYLEWKAISVTLSRDRRFFLLIYLVDFEVQIISIRKRKIGKAFKSVQSYLINRIVVRKKYFLNKEGKIHNFILFIWISMYVTIYLD